MTYLNFCSQVDRVLEPYHDENGTIREGNAMSQNIRNLDKSIHRDNAKHEKKDRHSQI